MAQGGDIIEVTYNHDTVGSGTIYCKSNEDATVELGGYRSSDDEDMITGNGEFMDQINYKRPSIELPPINWHMTSSDEQQKLSDMAGSAVLGKWTVNHINGTIWGGTGKPVGNIPGNTNQGTLTLKLAFTGKLKKLS